MLTSINSSRDAVVNCTDINKINVVVVSDCEISMAGLKAILRKNGRVCVVAECENLDAVPKVCGDSKPDVVIFNVVSSRDAICRIADSVVAISPSTRMIVLNKIWSMNQIFDCVSRGILGFIAPPNPAGGLMIALETVARGCMWIGPDPFLAAEQPVQSAQFGRNNASEVTSVKDSLSPRESEIADLVAQGLSNRAIADVLVITVDTVKSHLHHIMTKLAVRDRTQIVMKLHPMAQEAPATFVAVDKLATLHSSVRLRAS